MKNKTRKTRKRTSAILIIVACLFSLLLPLLKKAAEREMYECVWSDGSTSIESYSSAYQSLVGIDRESVLLYRQELTGRIASAAGEVYSALLSGNLAELLKCSYDGTRIEGAALYRTFSKRVWYSGEYFIWTGNQIKRASSAKAEELVLLSGSIPSRILKETNAATVHLRADATILADTFVGSSVQTIYAEAPYLQEGGAIYLDTAGGKRLIAALPTLNTLTIGDDLIFADAGALLACQSLQSLTLPFLGSSVEALSDEYAGEVAHLFSNGKEYLVPKSLSHIRVTGGSIVAFAFYACMNLKEIDACRVDPNEISDYAFLGLDSLELLHSSKRDVLLSGEFTSQNAECGCTVFERMYAQN